MNSASACNGKETKDRSRRHQKIRVFVVALFLIFKAPTRGSELKNIIIRQDRECADVGKTIRGMMAYLLLI